MSYLTKSLGLGFAAALLTAGVMMAGAAPASATTFCVSKTKSGCMSTITAAVNGASAGDTIDVFAGTYNEGVVIGIPLSLIGAGASSTKINASGQANGVYIDGYDNAGLGHVTVSGFTIQNAQFEGILANNVTDIVLESNKVINNDLALNGSCSGQPAFETSEGDDCGEGIHLMGVDHSIVANNLVEGNSGGILLSDETAETHDNFVTGNDVEKNIYDCGITLASHPQYPSGSPLGVNRNSIIGNTSNGNGTAGEGAGVGIFAGAVGGTAQQNVVSNNKLTNNGLPGVTFHAHAPGEFLNDNVIVGNLISGNAADTDDAATSGPTGINIYGASPITGTVISQNQIKGEAIDIAISTSGEVDLHLNDLGGGKSVVGVSNGGDGIVNASQNYWGCAKGPGNGGCTTVEGTVTTTPFLTAKAP